MAKKETTAVTMEKIASLAKQRGFIYPSSEIYGGYANTWDYGPLGAELKNNYKKLWWKHFVQENANMVGTDTAIIMNPKVWEASGHVGEFGDILVDCKKCHNRFRADHLVEDAIGIDLEGQPLEVINKAIKENKIKCENCKSSNWTDVRHFSGLFKTHIGVLEDKQSLTYLRGETAQGMFVDFKQILNSTRKKLPFGIAQIGKAFRNEITPGNYIFRTREFEIAEFEYFINENDWKKSFEYWLAEMQKFAEIIGIKKNQLHLHEIPQEKRAHYSKRTVDLEFEFPFGIKELWGIAYRTDYDLRRHQEYSGQDLSYADQINGQTYIPHVIEPTFGVDRTLLAIMLAAYDEEEVNGEMRTVLRLSKALAPYKIAVLPLSKKEELIPKSKEVFDLLKSSYMCEYDETQSIGKRYRRQDEIGTPYCITIDFETLEDKKVTVRDRDTMKQDRVEISNLPEYFVEKL